MHNEYNRYLTIYHKNVYLEKGKFVSAISPGTKDWSINTISLMTLEIFYSNFDFPTATSMVNDISTNSYAINGEGRS